LEDTTKFLKAQHKYQSSGGRKEEGRKKINCRQTTTNLTKRITLPVASPLHVSNDTTTNYFG